MAAGCIVRLDLPEFTYAYGHELTWYCRSYAEREFGDGRTDGT